MPLKHERVWHKGLQLCSQAKPGCSEKAVEVSPNYP